MTPEQKYLIEKIRERTERLKIGREPTGESDVDRVYENTINDLLGDVQFLLSIVKEQEVGDVLVRREDAARAAELVNDSIKAKGKFAAAILMMPPYPAPDCPICGYPIDNTGLCVLDGTHTTTAPTDG